NIGRTEVLIDPVYAVWRLRPRASKNGLAGYDRDLILICDRENWVCPAWIPRNTPPAWARSVVNEKISIWNVVIDTPGTAQHGFSAADRSKSEAESRCKVVSVGWIKTADYVGRKCQTARRRRKEG